MNTAILNGKQLYIVLKPVFDCPILCAVIMKHLRRIKFQRKQQKLLDNLLRYKVRDNRSFIKWINRFELLNYLNAFIDMYRDDYMKYDGKYTEEKKSFIISTLLEYFEDNTKYRKFRCCISYGPVNGNQEKGCYESSSFIEMIYICFESYYNIGNNNYINKKITDCEFIK